MCILPRCTFSESLLDLFFEDHCSSIQKKFSCKFRALSMLLWMSDITIRVIAVSVHYIIFILFLSFFSMLKETSNTFTFCNCHKSIPHD
uniref:Uncharacterized protein n=1 Tax=Zea mays TaxID=4577 RepID=C4J178_MAIZE|nr:unknown [Zea mays]